MGDVLVVTSFPDLESMGQSMMEFFGGEETGALFAAVSDHRRLHRPRPVDGAANAEA